MIAELPHDVQGHIWDAYTDGLELRIADRHRQAASKVIEQIDVLCNRDAAAREHLLDWIAHMLQHPTVKPGRAIVLVGREGCGKRMLVNLLSRLVPTLLTSDPRRDVYGRYNSLLEAAQLVVIEDAERVHLPSIKATVSHDSVLINERYRPARQITSYHRVMLLMKERKPWMSDARRFYPIQCTEMCMGTAEMANALREVVTTPAIDALREVLSARPVQP